MQYYSTRHYKAAGIKRNSQKSYISPQGFGVAFNIERGVKTVIKSFWDVWSTPTELVRR